MIRILKRLFRLMSQYKGRLYLGIALSMISNILGIVPIICGVWTIKLILDDSNGAAVLEPVYVLQLTTIILGSVLLRWLFAYIRATRQDSIAHEVTCAEAVPHIEPITLSISTNAICREMPLLSPQIWLFLKCRR